MEDSGEDSTQISSKNSGETIKNLQNHHQQLDMIFLTLDVFICNVHQVKKLLTMIKK